MRRVLIGAVALGCSGAWAGNGAIEGTVRFDGPRPALAALKVTKDQRSCGNELSNESLVVGPTGELSHVLVSVSGLEPAQPLAPTQGAVIDQRKCTYVPHVQALTAGTRLNVVNNDAILHNVHANVGARTVFNLAMPIKGLSLVQMCSHPGLLKLTCDAGHPWMLAWIWVFEHPYYAVTGADGAYRILDVPAGEHTVEFWHEPLDGKGDGVKHSARVTVREGEMARLDFAMRFEAGALQGMALGAAPSAASAGKPW